MRNRTFKPGRTPGRTHWRRASLTLVALVLIVFLGLAVTTVVLSSGMGARTRVDRVAAVRAEYLAEGAANIALREVYASTDYDANGSVGTFAAGTYSNSTLSTSAAATATTTGNTVTIAATAGATGTLTGANQNRHTRNLAVLKGSTNARPGLLGEIWASQSNPISNFNFNSTPARTGWWPNVDYPNWVSGGNRIFMGHGTNLTIRWRGQITLPTGGNWTFSADADDDVQIIVNGVSLAVRGRGGACARFSGSINLAAGTYPYELRWNDGSGLQCITAYWTPPSGSIAIIPPSAFSYVPTTPVPGIVVAGVADMLGAGTTTLRMEAFDSLAGPFTGTLVAGAARFYTDSSAAATRATLSNAFFDGSMFCNPAGAPGSILIVQNGAVLTGSASVAPRRYAVPRTYIPANFSTASAGAYTQWSGTLNLSGDRRHSSFAVGVNTVVNVTATTRLVVDGDVTFSDSATINIASGATLTIIASGNIYFWTSVQANVSGEPGRMSIVCTGANRQVTISDSARLHAHISNPQGVVNLWNNGSTTAEFVGTISSNTINFSNGTKVRMDMPGSAGGSAGTPSILSWVEP